MTSPNFATECARLLDGDTEWEGSYGAGVVIRAVRLASRATVEGIVGVLRTHSYSLVAECCTCGFAGLAPGWHAAHVAERVVAHLKGET